MTFNKDSFILVSSILGVLTFSLIYMASLLLTSDEYISTFCLVLLILFTAATFFAQPSDLLRAVLLLGITLSLPMISFPLMMESNILGDLLQRITTETDRIQIRNIPVAILSFLFSLKTLIQLSKSNPQTFFLFSIIIFLFVGLLFLHDYQGYSIFQTIIDFFYFLGAFSVFIFFRFLFLQDQIDYLYNLLFQVIFLFSVIILIDFAISLSGAVSWAWSYRDALQGVLYSGEVSFSFVLSITLIFLFSTTKQVVIKFVLLLCFFTIFLTEIDTALFAALLSLVLVNNRSSNLINVYSVAVIFIISIVLALAFLDPFSSTEASSLWTRAGVIYIVYNLLAEGSWLTGIMPGVVDFSMPSNLALAIFNTGFSEVLIGLPEVITHELEQRADYATGDPILPHNSAIALFSAYGILFLIPVIYYYYVLPLKTVINVSNTSDKRIITLGRILIFICLFSTFHPLITPILIVFLGELLRFNLLKLSLEYKTK